MKNIKILSGTIVMMFFVLPAFSFTTVIHLNKFAVANFYLNPDGSRGAQVSGQDQCSDENMQLCSQEYDTTTGLPTGNVEKLHFGPRP